MDRLKVKLLNFEYWNGTNPNQYDITFYDLKLCQTAPTTKQYAHKALITDTRTLKNAFPDNKDMVKSLNRIEKKLSGISRDKDNVNFWKTTATKLWDEQMKKIEIKESLDNTAREAINKTARDVFKLDGKKDETINKRKASLRSNDKNNLKKQKSDDKVNTSTLSETDNVLLNDNSLSTGTIIKRKAVDLFNDGAAVNSRDYKIMTNGLSSILDICDITESSQKSLFKDSEWDFLVTKYTEKYSVALIPVYELIFSTWKIVMNNIKNSREISFGLIYLYQIFPKHLRKQHFFCLKLCEHMLNLVQMHPTMLIKMDPPTFSENDYLRVVWSNFFEYLFPASGNIKIKTGETTYYKSAENKSQLFAHVSNTSKIIGFKIDLRLLFHHNSRDIDICAGEIASHDGDNKIISDEGKLNRESKDILDNLISIIPQNKSHVSMGWSIQIGGSSCFFSSIHLDADGLYVKVPKFQFVLPSTIADLDNYTDVLSKLLTFRRSMYSISDTIEECLAIKYSVETALGRGKNNETSLDPRIFWIRDSYYTPPSNVKPVLPAHLFGCTRPAAIMNKLSSLLQDTQEVLDQMYRNCVFDDNGWTFTGDHWFNKITNGRSTSSPYESSDDEEDVTSSDGSPIVDSDSNTSAFDTVIAQDPGNIAREPDATI